MTHGVRGNPAVTGVLPVALESATKTLQAILLSGKEYICAMKLHGDVSSEKLRCGLGEFTGEIYQRPPVRSSVKRQTRVRVIYGIDVLEIENRTVLLKINCQSGTYIRKLIHDVGEALGCGAHMAELRRTRAGPFVEDESLVTLHDLSAAMMEWRETGREDILRRMILPVEKSVELLPHIWVKDSTVEALCQGAALAAPGVVKLTSTVERG
ncbi:MAG: RNA-guided pseudouridylation complex pseudouridine synthase subunit Cbf5, partial [Candidatus Bathyarchaeia archaeon]